MLGFAERNEFRGLRDNEAAAPGDLLLLCPSPIQAHLAIQLAPARIVHAHAGLGRVVIEQANPQAAARWRLRSEGIG